MRSDEIINNELIIKLLTFFSTFPSAEAVLSGARHMIAFEISRDPMVKQTVREVYYKRAKLYVTPTKKGKKVMFLNIVC